jgi:hypothetical protein
MTPFFGFSALVSTALLACSLAFGYLGNPNHLLVSLLAAFVSISAHCLIFGIFTGAGKDTRELVQDLHLDPEFVGKTKSFRKICFPPALYSIFLILITAFFGGALSTKGSGWIANIHALMAWITLAYNAKTFLLEYRSVRENSEILKRVNHQAAHVSEAHPELLEEVNGPGGYEWGSHVFALGKFLCFMGWNTYLPYIYMRFIMGMIDLAVWPFVIVSVIFLIFGYFLRWKYKLYRPGSATPQKPAVG